jgi:hypothetical protein
MSLNYDNEEISEKLTDDLQSTAEYIRNKEEERELDHIAGIHGNDKGDLIIVSQYNNFVGDYINEIFHDFVEAADETYGAMILTGEQSNISRINFVFQKEPNDAIKYFTLYSVALGVPSSTAVPIGEEVYNKGQSEPLTEIAKKIRDSLPSENENYNLEDIQALMNIETPRTDSNEEDNSSWYSRFWF